ncbi:MAG TPA: diacylglycerol kinase family protein [Anaerolineae bacterium]|jgi:YegS/Rv2252/BmrU family lipid kinase
MTTTKFKHIHVIINPAAGQDEPVLNVLNSVLRPAEVKWEVFVTNAAGDAHKFAQQAIAAGVDAVAVYGGDGTVTEVAGGLLGSNMPLAILPGGTANVMSIELGIPPKLADAVALVCDPSSEIRLIDMGMVNERPFFGHVAIGLEADMHLVADRSMKDRYGFLAYPLAAFQALVDRPVARVMLKMDAEMVEMDILNCMVTNLGSIGMFGASMANNISVSDGLLDVILIRNTDIASIGDLVSSVTGQPNQLPHWQVHTVNIRTDPVQRVTADGEVLGTTPVDIRVLPNAIRVIVPASAAPKGAA